MKKEHKKSGMIDNRKVSDNHQQGIERVIQRDKSPTGAQHGRMGEKAKGESESHWKREGGSLTPRRA